MAKNPYGELLCARINIPLRQHNALGEQGSSFYADAKKRALLGDLYYDEAHRKLMLLPLGKTASPLKPLMLSTTVSESRIYPRPGFVYIKDLPYQVTTDNGTTDNGATAQLPGLLAALDKADVINAGCVSHMSNNDTVTLVEINQRALRRMRLIAQQF